MWNEIRDASEAGIDDDELVEIYPMLTKGAIKMRRSREKWLTPRRVAADVAAEKARRSALLSPEPQKVEIATKSASEMVASKIVEILDRNNLRVAEMADKAIRDSMDRPPSIETAADLMTYLKALRLAGGVENENKKGVTINLGAFLTAPANARPVVDV